MDNKKTKKSEYNRKFRELQKSKIQNETVAPKIQLKEQVKVEAKPEAKRNFFFQTLKNKMMESAIIILIPITLKTIHILASKISSTVHSQVLQPTLQREENHSFNIIQADGTNF